MSKEKIYKDLIAIMTKGGKISSSEYAILLEKGNDLGLDKATIDLLIKLELSDFSGDNYSDEAKVNNEMGEEDNEYTFKSAITRGGYNIFPTYSETTDLHELVILLPNIPDLERRFTSKYISNLINYNIKLVENTKK